MTSSVNACAVVGRLRIFLQVRMSEDVLVEMQTILDVGMM